MGSERKPRHAKLPGTVNLPESSDTTAAAAYPSPPNSPPDHHCSLVAEEDCGNEYHSATIVSLAGASIQITSPGFVTRPSTLKTHSANEALNVSTLRDLLGIKNWQCGALTKNKKACGWYISRKLRDPIDIHIHSILMLYRSSPRLQADLEKLVDLVHCSHHKRGYARKIRLDAWTVIFPPGPDQASSGALVEREIASSFGQLTTQCIGTTRESRRCENKIGGQRAQNCTKTVKEIAKAGVYLNDVNLDHYLRVLAANMCCYHHTNQSSLQRVTCWKVRIVAIRERASVVSTQPEESTLIDSSERRVSNQKPPTIPNTSTTQRRRIPLKVSDQTSPSPCSSIDCFKNPAAHWSNEYDTTPFDILEKCEKPDDYQASYNAVRCKIMEKLDIDEQEAGYVYAYEVEGNKGFVKIGYTSRPVNTRHNEWSFDCNRRSIPLFPTPAVKAALVPHAYRVEKLCHAELSHRQTIIYCHGCLRTHNEWFQVSRKEAIAAIKKWTAWIKTDPYQPAQLFLKEEEAEKVSDINHYLDDLSMLSVESLDEDKS
ncbi:hypothetical protein F1880_000446 [Penicillium rolfsii]|nr:hypothetical protein F1880_000446 [Penicillium rolfsii]